MSNISNLSIIISYVKNMVLVTAKIYNSPDGSNSFVTLQLVTDYFTFPHER